jgi:biopolymer transport protein ExbB/TolQ
MKFSRVAISMLVMGLALVAFSFVWPFVASSTLSSSWTKEQARQHAETSAKLHQLAHERGHLADESANHSEKHVAHSSRNEADLEREFKETEAKYKEGDAKLAYAQSFSDRVAFWIRCFGGILLLLGLTAHFRHRQREAA